MDIIDLFCGLGGMSLGFEKAGFHSVLAIDKWNDAIVTYNANRKKSIGTTVDIHDFSNEQLETIKKRMMCMELLEDHHVRALVWLAQD